jgi:hypothetical protein
MKATTFGCLILFHMTASLQNAYGQPVFVCERRTDRPIPDTNPLNALATLLGNSQAFDADPVASVRAFPYVGETAGGDRLNTDS